MDNSKGRYWDRPWSLVDGCTPCSPGCEHCWSASMAHRFRDKDMYNLEGRSLTDDKGHFNGTVWTHPDRLDIPLRRKKPTVYSIWNDLFHEHVPWEFIQRAYGVMARTPQHTYLVLTKRTYWARQAIGWIIAGNREYAHLPNVWHGLTVCNQAEADEKIPELLKVPGKKWLSIEPMLGRLNLEKWLDACPRSERVDGNGHSWVFDGDDPYIICAFCGERRDALSGRVIGCRFTVKSAIDAVILGGETGPGARPCKPSWVTSVKDQCEAANVPFFFKQWGDGYRKGAHIDGEYIPMGRLLEGKEWNALPWREAT